MAAMNKRNECAEEGEHLPTEEGFHLTHYGYGKSHVRLLYVSRAGPTHSIREYTVDTQLQLDSTKDYLVGNNEDIIATDTQKNAVYVLAKQHGVQCPENFAVLLCQHFLNRYHQVSQVKVAVEESPWRRLMTPEGPHNHSFLRCPTAVRFCSVQQQRSSVSGIDGKPVIRAGLCGLRIMKTTQSKFEHFAKDEFRTLPDADDRVMATEVSAEWQYADDHGEMDYCAAWRGVRSTVISQFAGPPDTGVLSRSVQHTMYRVQRSVLYAFPQISSIEIRMPNMHYLPLDLSHFSGAAKVDKGAGGDIFLPVDHPSGQIHACLERGDLKDEPSRCKL